MYDVHAIHAAASQRLASMAADAATHNALKVASEPIEYRPHGIPRMFRMFRLLAF